MPSYSTTGSITALYQGDTTNVWSAETVAAGTASRQVALAPDIGAVGDSVSVELSFSGAPGAFGCDFQTADTDADANYITKSSVSTVNASNVARLEIVAFVAKFARLKMTSLTNAVTTTGKISQG